MDHRVALFQTTMSSMFQGTVVRRIFRLCDLRVRPTMKVTKMQRMPCLSSCSRTVVLYTLSEHVHSPCCFRVLVFGLQISL